MKRDMLFYHPESGSYLAGSKADANDLLIDVTGDDYHTRDAIIQGEWIGSNPLPRDLCKKGTEHGHQTALFAWTAAIARVGIKPEANHMFAIPNGGARGGSDQNAAKRTGAMLVAEGLRKGVPDIFLPVPSVAKDGISYAGLFIEMKKSQKGRLSPDQKERIAQLQASYYCVAVCWSWEEGRDALRFYLGF